MEVQELGVTSKITKVPETLRRLYDVRGRMVRGFKFKDLAEGRMYTALCGKSK